MEADKNEWRTLQRALNEWEHEGKLTRSQAEELKKSIHIRQAERQQVAQYFFFIALSCAILAFGAIFIDEKLLEKIKAYFSLSDITISALSALSSAGWFWYVRRRRQHLSITVYESYMVLGALPVLTTLVYLFKVVSPGHTYTLFLFSASAILCILSIWFRSRGLWVVAILSLMGWFGEFSTTYSTNYLFLGMNYPVRLTLFGLLIIGLSFLQLHVSALRFTQRATFVAGLVIFFTAMWGVSVFGNYNYLEEWEKVPQIKVLIYSILFGVAAIISFVLGIRYKDDLARDFGVLFLLINLYTRYFEYFWDTMNKGIFFLILAITFGLLGRWLERRKRSRKTLPQEQP
jgi:uncharacterized membrane protein